MQRVHATFGSSSAVLPILTVNICTFSREDIYTVYAVAGWGVGYTLTCTPVHLYMGTPPLYMCSPLPYALRSCPAGLLPCASVLPVNGVAMLLRGWHCVSLLPACLDMPDQSRRTDHATRSDCLSPRRYSMSR